MILHGIASRNPKNNICLTKKCYTYIKNGPGPETYTKTKKLIRAPPNENHLALANSLTHWLSESSCGQLSGSPKC